MNTAITICNHTDALREIRAAQQQDRVAHLYCAQEEDHDAIIGNLLVETDQMDYAEQTERPTDIWGDLDGLPFRASLRHG